jgi:23S rRNA (uracil1939-C5)-methyltransferase
MQEYTITLEKHLYGGECLGRLQDGRAVFVPFGLPGETVSVQVVEEKEHFVRADLLEVLEPSPERVAPRCKHFGVCGGCQSQHMSYAAQLAAKEDILADQLTRLGGLSDPPVKPIVPSPEVWNYRNYIQFHQDGQGRLGFKAASSDQVVPIEECHLPLPALNQLWPRLNLEELSDLLRVGMRAGAEDELMLVLESDSDEAYEFEVDFPITAVQIGPEQVYILAEGYAIPMQVLGRTFRLSAGAFFQAMVEYLLASLPLTPQTTLLEVYCGVGLFSAFIAPRVARLVGIESHPAAVQDFVVNLDEFDNVEIYEAEAEEALPTLDLQPDVVLVDPPRAGLDKSVLDAILDLRPETLAYVSCDPATLGRDAKRLVNGGYLLEEVTPFDLFPQTYHIESISLWHPRE